MYDFKKAEEIAWFVVVAAVLAVAQILVTLEPEKVEDWKTWAIALAGAVVRAAAGAVLSQGLVKKDPPPTGGI